MHTPTRALIPVHTILPPFFNAMEYHQGEAHIHKSYPSLIPYADPCCCPFPNPNVGINIRRHLLATVPSPLFQWTSMKGNGNTYPPDVKPTAKGNIPTDQIRASFSVSGPDGISKAGHGPKSSSTGFKNTIKKFDGDFPVSYITFKTNNTLPSGNYGITNQDPFHLFDTGPWDVPPIPFFVPNSTDFNTFLDHNMIVKIRFAKGNLLS